MIVMMKMMIAEAGPAGGVNNTAELLASGCCFNYAASRRLFGHLTCTDSAGLRHGTSTVNCCSAAALIEAVLTARHGVIKPLQFSGRKRCPAAAYRRKPASGRYIDRTGKWMCPVVRLAARGIR